MNLVVIAEPRFTRQPFVEKRELLRLSAHYSCLEMRGRWFGNACDPNVFYWPIPLKKSGCQSI